MQLQKIFTAELHQSLAQAQGELSLESDLLHGFLLTNYNILLKTLFLSALFFESSPVPLLRQKIKSILVGIRILHLHVPVKTNR